MPTNTIPLVNGKAYAWANVSIMVAGAIIVGITKIMYSDSEDKENGYGQGKMPIDRAEGNYEAKASVTIKAADAEALAAKAPGGRLQDFGVFDVIVNYLVGTAKVKHIIHNCEFKNNGRDVSQGDKKIEHEYELLPSHISWK